MGKLNTAREGREGLLAVMDETLGRAQQSGVVRADATSTDVLLITAQFVKLPPVSRGSNPGVRERLLTVALDGLRAEAPTPLPASPPARSV